MSRYEGITIYRWMRELKLEDVELLVYATIFHYSQDGVGAYRNSIGYIGDFFGVDPKDVKDAIRKLKNAEFIISNSIEINDVIIEEYKVNQNVLNDKEKERIVGRKHVTKPTIKEVENYIEEMEYNVDAIKFWTYYERKNWKIDRKRIGCEKWKDVLAAWNTKQIKYEYEKQEKMEKLEEKLEENQNEQNNN